MRIRGPLVQSTICESSVFLNARGIFSAIKGGSTYTRVLICIWTAPSPVHHAFAMTNVEIRIHLEIRIEVQVFDFLCVLCMFMLCVCEHERFPWSVCTCVYCHEYVLCMTSFLFFVFTS